MKKHVIFYFLIYSLFLFSQSLFAEDKKDLFTKQEISWIKNNPIVRYSEINWKPLSIIEDNRMKGIMGDYLDLVAKKTGLSFEYVPATSWPNVLEKFKNNEIDLIPGIGSSPQEKKLGLVSKRYVKYPMVIVSSDKFAYIEGLNDLKDFTIAVPKYYTSYNFIVEKFPEIKTIATNSIEEALLLVANRKADVFVGHIASSLYYISQLHLSNLKISGTAEFEFEHHYLIQNKNPLLLSIINKTFDSITTQERKNIYSKWIQTTIVEENIDKRLIYIILTIFIIIIGIFLYRQNLLKKYNNKLVNTNKEVEGIINSTLEAIIITENRICIDINNSALEMLNIKDKKYAIGKSLFDFIADKDKELVKENISKNITQTYEIDILRQEGTTFHALVKGTNLIINNKEIRLTSVIDISELKNKEKLLIEQSKMAAVGEMIGNIAHQWRQPLSVITTIISGWQVHAEFGTFNEKRVLEESKVILSHAKYLSQTIDDFRTFIKGQDSEIAFNLTYTLENLFRLTSSSIKANQIILDKKIKSKKTVLGNQNELLQALINILNNSIDALKLLNKNDKVIFFDVKDSSNNIVITITDNAGGIEEKVLSKIFEPYFTTKYNSNGTGLGLYMTYNIIKKLEGNISVRNVDCIFNNKNFRGAEFKIILPIA